MKRLPVLVSPDAGRGRTRRAVGNIFDSLRARGVEPVDITAASAAESQARVADVVTAGGDRIVVVGGDGIVHLALQAVAGTTTALGVVPVGTANDFARAVFGPDQDVDAAVARALSDPHPIDAIRVGDRWVATVATAGFSAAVNQRANHLVWPRGQRRYSVATVLELPRMVCTPTTIIVDGTVFDYDVGVVAVANTAWFGGGMEICPGAVPDDGQLDVTVAAGISRRELLRFFHLVFDGRHVTHPKVHTHRGRRIEVIAAEQQLWGDGEPIGQGSVVLEAIPHAVAIAGATPTT